MSIRETAIKEATAGTAAGERRTERVNLRLTVDEAVLIRQAADARRQTITQFLVQAATHEAKRAMIEERRLVLADQVFDRLAAELDEEDEPIEALVNLIKKPRRVQLSETPEV